MTKFNEEVFVTLHQEVYVIRMNEKDKEKIQELLKEKPNLTDFENYCFDNNVEYTMDRVGRKR